MRRERRGSKKDKYERQQLLKEGQVSKWAYRRGS